MNRVAWLLAIALAGCSSVTHVPVGAKPESGEPHAPIHEASAAPASRSIKEATSSPVGYYRIQAGDTLHTIAFERHLDVADLAAWNRVSDPARIRSGDLLRITPPAGAPVPVSTAATVRRGEVPSRAVEPVDEGAPEAWSWPGRGELLARFGDAGGKGIDIAGKAHQPVYAAASGMVVYAGSGLRGYGKLIIIRHGQTLLSAYAHNARLLVYDGQSVRRGQQIGEMGDSDADRIKLHFEIREHGKPVDPLTYLPKSS